MGAEDQAEEREVLLSIFPDEITDISPTEFRISITLDLPPDDNETDLTPPVMLLTVRYPEAYPDAEPYLDLSAPPNAEVHPLFSVADDREHLLEALQPTIAENLGMAMVFTLVSALKDEAEALVASRRAEAERVREEAALAAEREENKKFHGTAVTPESFIAWRDKFFKEMEEIRQREEEEARLAEAKKRGSGATREVKLTGRQLWEGGLVGKIDEDDIEDGDDITEEVEKLKVEA